MSRHPSKSSAPKKGKVASALRPIGLVLVLLAGYGLAGLATGRDDDGGPLTSRFTVAELSALEIPLNGFDVGAAMARPASAALETAQLAEPSRAARSKPEVLPKPVPKPTAILQARLSSGKAVYAGPKGLPIPVKKPAWFGRRS